ncbi:alpha/beta hydrolase [Sphingomonas sp. CL5.1]|uniref:alpha/beta hydrolase n=1 Tax=Sphingomonas sp. CL5.1 TaxID=2653203 RepID=UPI001581C346|nr:alpha/beta hydrolase [Sphingomonas sp. CL5.1]QKS00491.1 alpha/beta hydrolase [Sphingomonas sp. CL5.1]
MTGTIKAFLTGPAIVLAMTGSTVTAQQRGFGAIRGQWAGRASMKPVPPPGARIERDIAYGADPAQRLDLYRPAKAEGAPILVMVHGGGWSRGDKANPGVVANKVNHWLPRGFILVSINYRMVPGANPLEQANDVAKALAFVQARAREWGGDAGRVVLMGHSAGAHLVALLAAAPGIAKAQGAAPWIGTIALDSAAYDIPPIMQRQHLSLYDDAFGSDPRLWHDASPMLRLESAPAPMLLVCSTRRADSCPPAEAFAARVRALHGRATVAPVDMTHAEINQLAGADGAYTVTIDTFLKSIGLN